MTDPHRLPDLKGAVSQMPVGSAIIYRHFGKQDRLQEAQALRQLTFAKAQQLLIGQDPELAIKVGADGVHFTRRTVADHLRLWRSRCPDWIITQAAKKSESVFDLSVIDLDALFVSSIFKSQSPSAGHPIGVKKLSQIVNPSKIPIIALGGVNMTTAPELIGSGAAGLAGIGFAQKILP